MYTYAPATQPTKPAVAQADNLTIAAFILAFFMPVVGAIMGHVSRHQAKRAGMRPSALATWAVGLGWTFTAIWGVIAIALAASVGAAVNQGQSGGGYTAPVTAPSTAPSVAAPPVSHPNGTYSGSCDYTLTSNIYGNDHLIGEVDLVNTGNVGTDVHVRITWPQEGYAPIVATRTVKTHPGQHLAVRFHIAVASAGNVITQLQSWQQSHNYKTGCTYKATMTKTFGPVS